MDVDGLQGAERALDPGEAFVGADGRGVIERFLRQAGAHDIDSVERRLGGDRRRLAMEREARLADDEVEVLGHLVPVDDGADLERNPASPRSGLRARRTAAAMTARSFSVAASRSSRLRARSRARSGLRQTISRSPG